MNLLKEMEGKDLLVDGSRNNDAVNLAILAYDEDPSISRGADLFNAIIKMINDNPNLMLVDAVSDIGYLEDKCNTLIDYLPGWYDTGDIYDYAII